ncbi:MAG: SpoIIE family protein phosphatase [Candidatus Latescibacteria bacterium]|nr:SpoIIE family protein phosphatase [Candidatus Latescibacterota bacterium]
MNRCLALWSGFLLLGLAWPAAAHNGAVAIAVPVDGIKVDGDLSDWPAGMRRYPIALPEIGDKPKGPEDFRGNFRVGYDAQEHARYVGVEVQDESALEGPGDASIKDGCEVFLAVDHKEGGGPAAQWVMWGNTRKSFGTGKLEDARVEVRQGKGGPIYEWRLDLQRLSGEPGPIRRATVSGVLHSEMRHQLPLEQLFANLNQTLHARLGSHTFVCFSMAQFNPLARSLRLANGGCPYPYHYRAATGEVVELQIDAYPLGVRPDTSYRGIEVQLELGDRVVFCSDGIAEAGNARGEIFGFERTAETIRRGCQEDLSAEALLARITQEVKAFSGNIPQGDDQTVVVLKVDDRRNA